MAELEKLLSTDSKVESLKKINAIIDYKELDGKLTNCILEAPNGIASYSGSTITLKAGLKVLMPDGLNSDGTLKNLEYTLENDVNVVRGQLKTQIAIFLKSDGVPNDANFYHVVNDYSEITTNLCLYYVINENNIYYRNSQGSISKIICAYIGDATTDGTTITSNITNLTTQKPINLLTMSNKNIISGWGMPSNRYIDLTLGASGTTYTAPANGYLHLYKEVNSADQYVVLTNTNNGLGMHAWVPKSGGGAVATIPVKKGDIVSINYTAGANVICFRFIYAEGEL